MATLPKYLGSTANPMATEDFAVRTEAPRKQRDRYQLRALPHEDVFFFCKKIDNSRLVRETDPRSGSACWSVIGAACLTVALLGGVLAPNILNTVAGYKLEALRVEAQNLAAERRTLELEEAERLSPDRLDRLAQGQHLVTPAPNQVVHLETRGDSKVAMVKE